MSWLRPCLFLALFLAGTSAKSSPLVPKATVPRIKTERNVRVAAVGIQNDKNEAAWVSGIKNSLASALAAGCSKLILAPFDTIKTLQQHSRTADAANPLSLVQAAQVILKRPKGFLELYVSLSLTTELWLHLSSILI